MQVNSLPNERVSLVDVLAPSSSSTAQNGGWVDAAKFRRYLARVSCGVLGTAATVDFKLQQATSSGGAGAKDITGAAITQLVKATDDGKVSEINLDTASLDSANSFRYVRMVLTVGTAASLVGATLEGFDPFNAPANASQSAAVKASVSA
jgi:hypothetical protein